MKKWRRRSLLTYFIIFKKAHRIWLSIPSFQHIVSQSGLSYRVQIQLYMSMDDEHNTDSADYKTWFKYKDTETDKLYSLYDYVRKHVTRTWHEMIIIALCFASTAFSQWCNDGQWSVERSARGDAINYGWVAAAASSAAAAWCRGAAVKWLTHTEMLLLVMCGHSAPSLTRTTCSGMQTATSAHVSSARLHCGMDASWWGCALCADSSVRWIGRTEKAGTPHTHTHKQWSHCFSMRNCRLKRICSIVGPCAT